MFRMINNMAYVYFNNKNRSSRFLQCKKKIRTTDTWQTFLQAVLVCNTRLAAILILNVVEAKVHCNWIGNIRQFLHEAFIYYKNDILRFVEYHIAKINSQVTKWLINIVQSMFYSCLDNRLHRSHLYGVFIRQFRILPGSTRTNLSINVDARDKKRRERLN